MEQEDYDNINADIACVESILDYSWSAYRLQQDIIDNLNSKANSTFRAIGWVMGFSTLLLSLSKILDNLAPSENIFGILIILSYFATVSFLFCSFIYCLSTQFPRNVSYPSKIDDIITHYRELGSTGYARKNLLLKNLIRMLSIAEESLGKRSDQLSKAIKSSMLFLFLGFGCNLLSFLFYSLSILSKF